jgi:hypothetical protein
MRSQKSSPMCKSRRCPKPTRMSVRIFQSAQTTVRALSRVASPGAFSLSVYKYFINALL